MEVAARDPDDMPELEQLDDLERQMRALSARMLALLGAVDQEWPDDPAVPDLACEMALRQGISSQSASERLRICRALRELPALWRAHAQGRISWDQLRWLSRFVTPETEAEWVERAPGVTPRELQEESRRRARVRREQADREESMRSAWKGWDESNRRLEIHAELYGDKAAAVDAALDEAAQRIEVDDDVEDRRAARLADALVELMTRSGGGRRNATLVVHTDEGTLTGERNGERHLSETTGGVQLPAESVRRVGCDARVLAALHRRGVPVAITSLGRTVSHHQMLVLEQRDRGCTFPGCGSRWFLHAHHIRHWADGGPTTLENLTLLCGTHHRRVHEGGWTIRGRPPDRLEFVSRTGRVFTRAVPALSHAG